MGGVDVEEGEVTGDVVLLSGELRSMMFEMPVVCGGDEMGIMWLLLGGDSGGEAIDMGVVSMTPAPPADDAAAGLSPVHSAAEMLDGQRAGRRKKK
jgi:hypothetical protein